MHDAQFSLSSPSLESDIESSNDDPGACCFSDAEVSTEFGDVPILPSGVSFETSKRKHDRIHTGRLTVALNPTRTQVPRRFGPISLRLGHTPLLAASTIADALFEKNKQRSPNVTVYFLKCLSLPKSQIGLDQSGTHEELFDEFISHEKLEEVLGYKFNCVNLLQLARTHKSSGMIGHNEQLEFLGDAVLQIISTHWLYFNYQHVSEGVLTVLRVGLVNNQFLARKLCRLFKAHELSICNILVTGLDQELMLKFRRFEDSIASDQPEKDFNIEDALK